jgi:hypothetical protein
MHRLLMRRWVARRAWRGGARPTVAVAAIESKLEERDVTEVGRCGSAWVKHC